VSPEHRHCRKQSPQSAQPFCGRHPGGGAGDSGKQLKQAALTAQLRISTAALKACPLKPPLALMTL
jgi:hypothetical protein